MRRPSPPIRPDPMSLCVWTDSQIPGSFNMHELRWDPNHLPVSSETHVMTAACRDVQSCPESLERALWLRLRLGQRCDSASLEFSTLGRDCCAVYLCTTSLISIFRQRTYHAPLLDRLGKFVLDSIADMSQD